MIEIAYSSSFKKAFRKRVRSNTELEGRFWERLAIFQNQPFDPRLRTHKLSGRLKGLWSFAVDYDFRVVFTFLGDNRALLVDIGTHKEVY
jgi:addiction module RelE/StbE family toxin